EGREVRQPGAEQRLRPGAAAMGQGQVRHDLPAAGCGRRGALADEQGLSRAGPRARFTSPRKGEVDRAWRDRVGVSLLSTRAITPRRLAAPGSDPPLPGEGEARGKQG